MSSGQPSANPTVVDLSGTITIESLEEAWRTTQWTAESRLLVDMSECSFVEPLALAHIIGLLSKQTSRGCVWRISVPEKKSVREILYSWRFPEALVEAVGAKSFAALLSLRSQRYVEEEVRPRVSGNIIAIQSFATEDYTSPKAMMEATSDYTDSRYLNAIFRRKLGDSGATFGRRVIREAFANAINHPDAGMVQAGSALMPAPKRIAHYANRYFTFFVWDNGESIPSTIDRAIQANSHFNQKPFEEVHRTFIVRKHESLRTPELANFSISSKSPPDEKSSRGMLLLSAVFPGITGLKSNHAAHSDYAADRRGVGLFDLTNHVVDVLEGEVSIRSENIFLNLKKSDQNDDGGPLSPLSAKLVEIPGERSEIQGNLITFRIPFMDSTKAR